MSNIKELAKELCEKSGCHHKCNDTSDCVVEDEALLLINENKSNNFDVKSNNPIVEFVSYDGHYPCLCSGTLVLRIDGKIVELKGCLVSGGELSEDYSEAYQDKWSIDLLPEELKPLKDIITDLVNENVEFGCCGGCI